MMRSKKPSRTPADVRNVSDKDLAAIQGGAVKVDIQDKGTHVEGTFKFGSVTVSCVSVHPGPTGTSCSAS
jgi:hypothetical protein